MSKVLRILLVAVLYFVIAGLLYLLVYLGVSAVGLSVGKRFFWFVTVLSVIPSLLLANYFGTRIMGGKLT
jgi:cytochrome c biogenesis factor